MPVENPGPTPQLVDHYLNIQDFRFPIQRALNPFPGLPWGCPYERAMLLGRVPSGVGVARGLQFARKGDRQSLQVEVSTSTPRSTLQQRANQGMHQTRAQGPAGFTLPLFKWKFKESEKSKFERGLPDDDDVSIEGEKISHLSLLA